jgi:hypothetical protein
MMYSRICMGTNNIFSYSPQTHRHNGNSLVFDRCQLSKRRAKEEATTTVTFRIEIFL